METLGPYKLNDWEGEQSVYLGDCQDLGLDVPDNSVDLIFTDPPWDADATLLYHWLARWAARVLKPGGFLMAYAGSEVLTDYLGWCLACDLTWFRMFGGYQPDSNLKFRKQKTFVQWRPIPVFSKGEALPYKWVPDMLKTNRDKRYHPWGQGIEAPTRWIDCMVGPDAVVVDPFCGGACTLAVCRLLGDKYGLSFEIDEDAYYTARDRVVNTIPLPLVEVKQPELF
jgi:DNA modification methylase